MIIRQHSILDTFIILSKNKKNHYFYSNLCQYDFRVFKQTLIIFDAIRNFTKFNLIPIFCGVTFGKEVWLHLRRAIQ
jgi:hypothetical protein